MLKLLLTIMMLIFILLFDFGLLGAIIYGICWCLSVDFTWKLALGIWLIIITLKICFTVSK